MALIQWKWLRRIVRRNTNPIPQDRAALWKQRLSIAYAIIAWNAFGYICYLVYKGRGDPKYYGIKSEEELSLTQAQRFSKTLNVEKGKIIRYRGFTRLNEEEFDNTKKAED